MYVVETSSHVGRQAWNGFYPVTSADDIKCLKMLILYRIVYVFKFWQHFIVQVP
jgi:hypothetical protein